MTPTVKVINWALAWFGDEIFKMIIIVTYSLHGDSDTTNAVQRKEIEKKNHIVFPNIEKEKLMVHR